MYKHLFVIEPRAKELFPLSVRRRYSDPGEKETDDLQISSGIIAGLSLPVFSFVQNFLTFHHGTIFPSTSKTTLNHDFLQGGLSIFGSVRHAEPVRHGGGGGGSGRGGLERCVHLGLGAQRPGHAPHQLQHEGGGRRVTSG